MSIHKKVRKIRKQPSNHKFQPHCSGINHYSSNLKAEMVGQQELWVSHLQKCCCYCSKAAPLDGLRSSRFWLLLLLPTSFLDLILRGLVKEGSGWWGQVPFNRYSTAGFLSLPRSPPAHIGIPLSHGVVGRGQCGVCM